MSFNVGDGVRIVNMGGVTLGFGGVFLGQTGTITKIYSKTYPKIDYVRSEITQVHHVVQLDKPVYYYGDYTTSFVDEAHTLEMLYPLQQLSIEVLKEDDHAGQTYNPYNDTWNWL